MKYTPASAVVHGVQLPFELPPHPERYCPTGHSSSSAHSSQPVAPVASWYSPAAHLKHVDCSLSGLYVPGAQSVSTAAPAEQYVPSLHPMQSSSLVITSSALF